MTDKAGVIKSTRRSFMRILGAGALTGPAVLEGKGEGSFYHAKDITDTEVIKSYHDMAIPEDQLERTI